MVEPDREGTFTLICTELCGLGHSTMRVQVVVESEAEFDAWLAKQPDTPPEDEDASRFRADGVTCVVTLDQGPDVDA